MLLSKISAQAQAIIALLLLSLVGPVSAIESGVYGSSVEPEGERFQVLEEYRAEAVLDRETQLIWERSPNPVQTTWGSAPIQCGMKSVGGRRGWRVPSFLELITLIDPSPRRDAALPTLTKGHPFRGVQAAGYWTATALPSDSLTAYTVDFSLGDVASRRTNQLHPTWCVRGRDSAPREQPRSQPAFQSVSLGTTLG